jgi:cell shape-determining protein MreC
VHGDHSEILIGAGRQQGVHVGMTGYLMNGDTYLSELDVIATNKNTTRAIVKATPDQIREHINDAVINPSSVPKKAATKAHDFKTRVIKYSIEGGRTKVTIAGGTAYGVHAGDEVIMLDENGKRMPGGHFIVEEAEARTASAFVELIPDEVIRCKSVVVNP